MLRWPDRLETAPRKAIVMFFSAFARFLYVNAFPDSQICAYAPGKSAGSYAGRSPRCQRLPFGGHNLAAIVHRHKNAPLPPNLILHRVGTESELY